MPRPKPPVPVKRHQGAETSDYGWMETIWHWTRLQRYAKRHLRQRKRYSLAIWLDCWCNENLIRPLLDVFSQNLPRIKKSFVQLTFDYLGLAGSVFVSEDRDIYPSALPVFWYFPSVALHTLCARYVCTLCVHAVCALFVCTLCVHAMCVHVMSARCVCMHPDKTFGRCE